MTAIARATTPPRVGLLALGLCLLGATSAAGSAAAGAGAPLAAAPGSTAMVSVNSDEVQGNASCDDPSVSGDGNRVSFTCLASNLAPDGDDNDAADVLVRDVSLGLTALASRALDDGLGNAYSQRSSISADGRYVAFESAASDLVGQDTNRSRDVFVRDLASGATTLVSQSTAEAQSNGNSSAPSISRDGRYIAFSSVATNLVAGPTSGPEAVFLRDLVAGETRRISVSSAGAIGDSASGAPAVTPDGRFVAFTSSASNLVADDTNGVTDVFVRDRRTKTTVRVSVGANAVQGDAPSLAPAISANGRYVVFSSPATNLVWGDTNGQSDIFVNDSVSGLTRRMSIATSGVQGDKKSLYPDISDDGKFVSFSSFASNLITGVTTDHSQIFVRDRLGAVTHLMSVSAEGTAGNADSLRSSVSADGSTVWFDSAATNLTPDDTNAAIDVFTHTR